MLAHGSGVDDLLIPLLVVGVVAYAAFRPRLRRPGVPGAPSPECSYCGARLPAEAARCAECGFRVAATGRTARSSDR